MSPEEKINKDQIPNTLSKNSDNDIVNFLIKIIIVVSLVTASIEYLLPSKSDLDKLLPKIPETERNKLIMMSFIQNPYVLSSLATMEEEKGNFKKAADFLEAAIGLMEMHGASEKSLKKYQDRLDKLKNK